jgi:hypothetical protein
VLLEFDLQRKVDKNFLTNGIREKYSINHFSNYKENVFENSLQKILTDKSYSIPVLMNSHSFTKTDVNNQHKTLDTIDNIPNPSIWGKHFELLQKHKPLFY